MAQVMDFEADRRLKLLTDALRAGPGTPQWREALAEIRGTVPEDDEYQMLMTAREHLASGRRYREVRAGPEFSRRVMDAIERSPGGRTRWLPGAHWIAAIAVAVVLAVLAIVASIIVPRGDGPPTTELGRTDLVRTAGSASFDEAIGADWETFGSLSLEAQRGLRPLTAPEGPTFRGGGVFWKRELAPDQPFALEGSIVPPAQQQDVIVQLFVTEDPRFEGRPATSPRELVWQIRETEISVISPDNRVVAQSSTDNATHVEVRIALDAREALIESNGQRLWAGPHDLDPARPRTVGLRFMSRGGETRAAVQSLRVMMRE